MNDLRCSSCGYSWSGTRSYRCPECGVMADLFTDRARALVRLANQETVKWVTGEGGRYRWWHALLPTSFAIEPCNLLLAFVHTPEGVGKLVLASLVGNVAELEPVIHRCLPRRVRVRLPKNATLPASVALKRVFDAAKQESTRLNHTWIGTEHLLLGLAKAPDRTVSYVFRQFGVTHDKLERATCDYFESIGLGPASKPD